MIAFLFTFALAAVATGEPACKLATTMPPVAVIDGALRGARLTQRLDGMSADRMDRDLLYVNAQMETVALLRKRYPWLTKREAERLKQLACQ